MSDLTATPSCSKCDRFMAYLAETPVGPVWECPGCGKASPARQEDAPQKPARKDLLDRVNDWNEKRIVQAIIDDLAASGYTVMKQGQKMAIRSGSSIGAPDLLVTGHLVPKGMAVLLEPKVVKGWKYSSAQQRDWCEDGTICRVHSVEDARQAVRESLGRCGLVTLEEG